MALFKSTFIQSSMTIYQEIAYLDLLKKKY